MPRPRKSSPALTSAPTSHAQYVEGVEYHGFHTGDEASLFMHFPLENKAIRLVLHFWDNRYTEEIYEALKKTRDWSIVCNFGHNLQTWIIHFLQKRDVDKGGISIEERERVLDAAKQTEDDLQIALNGTDLPRHLAEDYNNQAVVDVENWIEAEIEKKTTRQEIMQRLLKPGDDYLKKIVASYRKPNAYEEYRKFPDSWDVWRFEQFVRNGKKTDGLGTDFITSEADEFVKMDF
ncbi:hypothetical protein B0J11DRAFT_582777 [Dendryphion nanum]|uniref:Uncharacterized protein n=1 Tax=Dendryphion nanum TaxID=256645 RepID=A0A9P9IEN4_9PLEO|nr:hypothetical protein B0J11DRAFT_582777 [Dendryphion nanum]